MTSTSRKDAIENTNFISYPTNFTHAMRDKTAQQFTILGSLNNHLKNLLSLNVSIETTKNEVFSGELIEVNEVEQFIRLSYHSLPNKEVILPGHTIRVMFLGSGEHVNPLRSTFEMLSESARKAFLDRTSRHKEEKKETTLLRKKEVIIRRRKSFKVKEKKGLTKSLFDVFRD